MRTPAVALALAATVAGAAAADPPDIDTLVARMKAALEPPRASVRQMTLSISGEHGGPSQWSLAQARKTVDGQGRILTVLLTPASARGIASLIIDGTPPETALYTPAVRRVRTLVPQDGYDAFLGSDFTYFDLGFVRRHDTYRLLGAEQRNGKDAWKIEQIPTSSWYYSKIVSWIDQTTMLPIERDYYSPAGQLWKVQTFDKVVTIDGQPVALSVTMRDTHTGGTSELRTANLRFGVDLPDSLFERAGLRQAADATIWKGLE
ncbi:MAG: outer membrane lipoprotein-sorting protein [Chloroflexi bacterium]|nr:outer membrane lipoprotein-sorting protein [Chloroflexota bacterium]